MDVIREEAERRHDRHVGHPTHRPLSAGYELVGLRCEQAFVAMFGGCVDLSARPGGDGGVDARLKLEMPSGEPRTFVVDVKGARKPGNLICEVGKVVKSTIYILGQYYDDGDYAVLLGWEWGSRLLAAPTRDFGYGVTNHYIARGALRHLDELRIRQTA
jgi:hypothetical protein